jgi:Cu/Ag efflux protein CusF
MRRTLPSIAAFLLAVGAPMVSSAQAQQSEMPAAGVAGAVSAMATVVAIDQQTRQVTLQGEDGKTWTFTAGPEVRNLAQVKRGDQVLVEYYEGLALALAPKGSGIRERAQSLEVTRAQPGQMPAGTITNTLNVVATVRAVDPQKRTVTLQGAKKTVTLEVAKDVDLSQVKVGDQVEASYVQSYAISVVPPPKVSGTVQLVSKAVALGVGIGWGSGTLTLDDGSVHHFKVRGLSAGDIGFSEIKASGDVYKLVQLQDFGGTYLAGAAGIAVGKGGSVIVLENDKGVVMHLKSTQEGVRLTLAPEGFRVELVD